MKVYHASKFIIESPDIYHSRDLLDFGKGFYLTSLVEQAKKYAQRFIFQGGKAYLNQYILDENLDREYKIKEFIGYNEEWLDFVALCRIGKQTNKFDMVTGGIADDKVFNTVDLYFSGNISKEEALKRLKFIHPNHQICILNQDILNKHLHFLQSDEIILRRDFYGSKQDNTSNEICSHSNYLCRANRHYVGRCFRFLLYFFYLSNDE